MRVCASTIFPILLFTDLILKSNSTIFVSSSLTLRKVSILSREISVRYDLCLLRSSWLGNISRHAMYSLCLDIPTHVLNTYSQSLFVFLTLRKWDKIIHELLFQDRSIRISPWIRGKVHLVPWLECFILSAELATRFRFAKSLYCFSIHTKVYIPS